MYKLKSQ